MKPRITVLSLGVADLQKVCKNFYRDGLGWPSVGIVGKEMEYGAVAFFDLETASNLRFGPEKAFPLIPNSHNRNLRLRSLP